MKKYLSSLSLSVFLFAPSLAFAAPAPVYLDPENLLTVNQELSGHMEWCVRDPLEDADLRAASAKFFDSLSINDGPVKGYFPRYTVPFASRKVSLTLPYSEKWSLRGIAMRPYFLEKNAIQAGPVVVVDNGIQDTNCYIGRKYTITLEKSSVAKQEAALRKTIKEGGVNAEDLPSMAMVLGGKTGAIIPSVIWNSGGYFLRYDRVLVNLPGGYLLTVSQDGSYGDYVNTEMLRIAASAK